MSVRGRHDWSKTKGLVKHEKNFFRVYKETYIGNQKDERSEDRSEVPDREDSTHDRN